MDKTFLPFYAPEGWWEGKKEGQKEKVLTQRGGKLVSQGPGEGTWARDADVWVSMAGPEGSSVSLPFPPENQGAEPWLCTKSNVGGQLPLAYEN